MAPKKFMAGSTTRVFMDTVGYRYSDSDSSELVREVNFVRALSISPGEPRRSIAIDTGIG